MPHPATKIILQHLISQEISYQLICHAETHTSEESYLARLAAGVGEVMGAKAILIKMDPGGIQEFNVFVLPATQKINSRSLKAHFGIKHFRFATPEELAELTDGLVPGSLPPFGREVFPKINHLYIDNGLQNSKIIGFNVADLTLSIILNCRDYLKIAQPKAIFPFSISNANHNS
jgi:prolyl-tRNA editing enzyme YbaK/EbsC (Cys-tRNA(Pro) deacylase)